MNSDDLRKLIQQKMAANPSLRSIMKRIQSGNATFKDTADYSRIYSELLGKCLSENVLDLTDREAAAADILRDSFDHTNSLLSQVQTNIDKKNGINIRPQTADFPLERVLIFSHSLVDPTVEDSVIQRRARSGTANISMSHHDDYMETNARFRSKAGLKCYITRETDGKCCKWCTAIAGRYVYGEEPHDVYRRHDNCGCSVIYENGRQRQDVWSKRTWEKPKVGAGASPPTKFTPEQARAMEQEKLRNIHGLSIDNGRGSGIIEARESMFRTFDDPMREVMGSAYENNREELFAIIDELESKGVEVDISESNNTMGYQPSPNMSGGSPGRVKMHRDSSLSAWEHERQHVYDDEKSGWNGRAILTYDMNEHYQWEVRAYEIEIRRARDLGRQDIVERLEQLLENERKAIFDE